MKSRPDPRRLLHRRSEHAYTDRLDLALPQEPEAVPADYQARLTRQAADRAADRDRQACRESLDRLAREFEHLAGLAGPDLPIESEVRGMVRLAQRIGRAVG